MAEKGASARIAEHLAYVSIVSRKADALYVEDPVFASMEG
jgi:hypothetical protein